MIEIKNRWTKKVSHRINDYQLCDWPEKLGATMVKKSQQTRQDEDH